MPLPTIMHLYRGDVKNNLLVKFIWYIENSRNIGKIDTP